jgi:hypothetical protein
MKRDIYQSLLNWGLLKKSSWIVDNKVRSQQPALSLLFSAF